MYQHVLQYLIVGLVHLSPSPPPSSYRGSLVKLFTTMGSLTALDLDMMKFAGRLWMDWGPKDVLGMMDPAVSPNHQAA